MRLPLRPLIGSNIWTAGAVLSNGTQPSIAWRAGIADEVETPGRVHAPRELQPVVDQALAANARADEQARQVVPTENAPAADPGLADAVGAGRPELHAGDRVPEARAPRLEVLESGDV